MKLAALIILLTFVETHQRVVPIAASEVVAIQLHGHYYIEPATVRIVVTIEPDAENRALRVEADGDQVFRASEVTLSGANEKRIHTLEFRDLPAGYYVLSALVFSSDTLRGRASRALTVTGSGAR